jgi:hypothetical protein
LHRPSCCSEQQRVILVVFRSQLRLHSRLALYRTGGCSSAFVQNRWLLPDLLIWPVRMHPGGHCCIMFCCLLGLQAPRMAQSAVSCSCSCGHSRRPLSRRWALACLQALASRASA